MSALAFVALVLAWGLVAGYGYRLGLRVLRDQPVPSSFPARGDAAGVIAWHVNRARAGRP